MLNAFVTASAAVPASLLVYAVTGRRWPALGAGVASAALPWLVLSSFGRREAVSYVAFLWALLALYRTVVAPGIVNDGLALAAIALASLAHGQLLVLILALPLAVVIHDRSPVLARHRLLAVVYAGLLVLGALAFTGVVAGALGGHWQLVRESFPPGLVRVSVQHMAALALSLGILPFLVGLGWLLATVGRAVEPRRHAFAAVALVAGALVIVAAASLDQRYADGAVRDRYLVYAGPVVALAAACAIVPLRWPRWSLLAAVLTWFGLGLGLSRVTVRVTDWFVMTDELLYERLAISVARTGSPLPRVHGELIESFNQLYPLLVSRVYGTGLVPESLHDAHVLNAFVMTSVLVPTYLLARSVTGRNWLAFGIGVLSVCVPWLTLSSFLLTEVVAYPAFAWAVFAVYRATALPRPVNDAVALAAIALAALARVQFLVLLLVLPAAVLLHELAFVRAGARAAFARHRLLVVAYGGLALGAIVLAATGGISRVLGTYAQTAQGAFPPGLPRAFVEHVAELSLSLAILPFLVAVGWLLATIGRRGDPRLHAFASVGAVTIAVVTLQVASFDERFGGRVVRDRYLFYVVPVVLVALGCALVAPRWPRWSLLVPAALVGAGFALYGLPRFEKLNVDTPASVLHDRIVELGGSTGGARAGLVLVTLVLVLLFAQGAALLGRAAVAAVLAGIVVFALPAETTYAFSRLFAVPGTSGRPLDHDQSGVFNWVDRAVGTEADVTMVPYPHLYGDYWATVAFWWDLEFWNKSVVRAAYVDGAFAATPSTFPQVELAWDGRGLLGYSPTRYVAQLVGETRFRIAGDVVWQERDTQLIDAGTTWRLEWASRGLYEDGWTKPDTEARVRVFAAPGQSGPMTRFLTFYLQPPGGEEERVVHVASSLAELSTVVREGIVPVQAPVCVRPGGTGEVRLSVLGAAPILGNPVNLEIYGRPRVGGLQVRQIALAGEIEPGC